MSFLLKDVLSNRNVYFPDKDNDHQISWQEFVEFQIYSQRILGAVWPIDMSSIRKEFSEMDQDSNGKICKQEFTNAFINLQKRFNNSAVSFLVI
jgi:Ca2+-binding EF-hand superfamily protein